MIATWHLDGQEEEEECQSDVPTVSALRRHLASREGWPLPERVDGSLLRVPEELGTLVKPRHIALQ